MAEQIYMCDVLFPEYRDGDDPAKYIKQTNDYLFLLREYLGYALDNLGVANFNAAQLGLLGDTITKPLNIRLDGKLEANEQSGQSAVDHGGGNIREAE